MSAGDGTEIGNCPSNYPNYNCLSDGACNVCGLISGKAEGCDITSITPVCDADSATSTSEDSATGKVAHCVKCTKSGMMPCLNYDKLMLYCAGYLNTYFLIIRIDGSTMGDGTEIGKCPSSYSNYRCLSTGACNVCGLISGYAEGCDITSTTPVCDADGSTSETEVSAVAKVAKCVKCRKSGKEYLDNKQSF